MIISFATYMKSKTKRNVAVILLAVIVAGAVAAVTIARNSDILPEIIKNIFMEKNTIEIGDCVDVHYIGRYASNNTIFASSYDDPENKTGGSPLKIFVSTDPDASPPDKYSDYSNRIDQNFVEGFIDGLIGLKEGDTKTIGPIPPEKAYGASKLGAGAIFNTTALTQDLNQTLQVLNLTDKNISLKWINVEHLGNFTMPRMILNIENTLQPVLFLPPYYLWENSSEIINITNDTITVKTMPTKNESLSDEIEPFQFDNKTGVIFPEATTAVWNDTTITIISSPQIGKNYTVNYTSYGFNITVTYTVEDVDFANNTINISYALDGSEEKSYQIFNRTVEFNRTIILSRIYTIPRMYLNYLFGEDLERAGYSLHGLAGETVYFDVEIERIYKCS